MPALLLSTLMCQKAKDSWGLCAALRNQLQRTGLLSQEMYFCLFAYVFKNRATLWRVSSNHYAIPENWCNWLLPLTVMCAAMPETLREQCWPLMPCCTSVGGKDKLLQSWCAKYMRNGGVRATQAFSLETPICLLLTLLQAALETPWNEPSREKRLGKEIWSDSWKYLRRGGCWPIWERKEHGRMYTDGGGKLFLISSLQTQLRWQKGCNLGYVWDCLFPSFYFFLYEDGKLNTLTFFLTRKDL